MSINRKWNMCFYKMVDDVSTSISFGGTTEAAPLFAEDDDDANVLRDIRRHSLMRLRRCSMTCVRSTGATGSKAPFEVQSG